MNNGWQVKTIGDICGIVNGGTPKTSVSEYWNGKHLWITPAEMGKRLTPFVDDTERKISDLGLRDSSAQMLPPNSVILSSRAPIGHLVINTKPMATNQGCKGLIPNERLNFKFLYYFLTSAVDLLNSLGTGATFKELSAGKLKEVKIPFPPLHKQQRIVEILDEALAGIGTAKTNTEKNLQNARSLFESHLGSVFSRRDEEWIEKSLGEVCDLVDCLHKTPTYSESGFPMVRVTDVKPGFLNLSKTRRVDEKTYVEFSRKHTPQIGDIVFSRVGSYGISSLVNSYEPFCLGQNTIFLIPKINSTFAYYFLNSTTAKTQFDELVEGTTQPTISMKSIRQVRIPVPTRGTQEIIAASLDILSAETHRLETIYQQKLALLEELKKSLLHQAFTGKL